MSNFDQTSLVIPISLPGALTVAAGKQFVTIPVNAELVAAYAQVGTAPVGADLKLQINKNGVSALTTLAVAATNKSGNVKIAYPVNSGTTGVDDGQPNLTAPSGNSGFNFILPEFPAANALIEFAAGDTVSVDVTQIGAGTAGSDLVVTLLLAKK